MAVKILTSADRKDMVLNVPQTLTDTQKLQARTNIGATGADDLSAEVRAALTKAKLDEAQVTDDCSAVERMGMSVKIVAGDERNIKITTPMDLRIAQMLLEDAL